jgi:glutamyl-tRNA synthetase
MTGDATGHAEPEFAGTDPDEMVQFERIGFARVDRHGDSEEPESVAYLAHE